MNDVAAARSRSASTPAPPNHRHDDRRIWHGGGIAHPGRRRHRSSARPSSTNTLGNNAPAVEATGGTPAERAAGPAQLASGPLDAHRPARSRSTDDDLVTDSSLIQGGHSRHQLQRVRRQGQHGHDRLDTIDAGVVGIGAQGGVSAVDDDRRPGRRDRRRSTARSSSRRRSRPSPAAAPRPSPAPTPTCPTRRSRRARRSARSAAPPAASGNTSSALASLFVRPGTSDQLLPTSAAVDSVPEAAVALPDGFTSSTTDARRQPARRRRQWRLLAIRDRGAFELQGTPG